MSGRSPSPEHHRSSLANLLLNLNTSSISSISATINGSARLADAGSDEERYYRQQHLENNTFDADAGAASSLFGAAAAAAAASDADSPSARRPSFVEGEDVRVVVVAIKDVRISDWKGGVRDWVLLPAGEPRLNGVR